MNLSRRARGYPLFIVVLVAVPAFAQRPAGGVSNAQSMPGMTSGTMKPSSPADRAMMAGMTKMSHDMSDATMTGNPDKDFVAMMIPHHEGAVDMAQVELKYGKDPAMRRLAKNIVAAQEKEIGEMQRWQAKHSSP